MGGDALPCVCIDGARKRARWVGMHASLANERREHVALRAFALQVLDGRVQQRRRVRVAFLHAGDPLRMGNALRLLRRKLHQLLRDAVRVVRLLVGHLALHLHKRRELELLRRRLRLHLEDGVVLQPGERVQLPVLPPPAEGHQVLRDRQARGVGLLEARGVLPRGERPLGERRLPLLRDAPQLVLEGHVRPLLPPAHAAARLRLRREEIGLLHLEHLDALRRAADVLLGRLGLEEELARDREGRGHADEARDARDGAADLVVEAGGVVDDVQVLVPRPARHRALAEAASLVGRLGACGVVAERVRLLRSVGGGDKVEDGVVALVGQVGRRELQLLQQQVPVGVAQVRLAVHRAPVAQHHRGAAERAADVEERILRRELQLHQVALHVVPLRLVGGEGDAALEERRRDLGHADHEEPQRLQPLLQLEERRRLPRTRPAGEDDAVERRQRRLRRGALQLLLQLVLERAEAALLLVQAAVELRLLLRLAAERAAEGSGIRLAGRVPPREAPADEG
eukprot:CAMPEP_0205882260 /NCGR_PEP_ID=MMETSP1083-20121108/16902_1 /ASSEMBLY_ACC=CAM_ASM_000430 /TAXON_ID=97485 /ORGANISM="Prymnesium parvum, Strain Texoma1" /LENGTH=512 /DNA_ID=CAMNT_0053245407 /DNA_START=285 /DNA_END=1819 /DNA_ORIENTATION=+